MRSCPDCLKPLLPATLRKASFERCTCGGVWVPFGQLELILERPSAADELGGQTSRRCPDCTLSMTPMVLTGGVPVERCSACQGTWLDWPDVVELHVKDLEALVRPPAAERYAPFTSPEPAAAKSVTGFVCPKCGTRTEFAKGNATASGLVCGNCVAKIQPMPRIADLVPDLDD